MAISSKIKKRITDEWLRSFPGLQPYAQNKLYKIIGCYIVGLELINLPRSENYRPHFVLYPLYKKDIESCLEYPVLMYEFCNNKGLQINLPYNDPNELFKGAQKIVSDNLKFKFNGDVPSASLNSLVESHLINDVTYKAHSGKRASLYEIKFYAALYAEINGQIQNVISQIQKESKSWNMQIFEVWRGKYDLWLEMLKEKINRREAFLRQIAINKDDKKLHQLKSSELTPSSW